MPKLQLMTKEESYDDRRKLFKNIWDTAMHMDVKEADIMSKPKVIKTQRLDEADRSIIGKMKKQRIKNLRHVCNRLLDFCDKQDADDVLYELIAGEKRPSRQKVGEPKPKKPKGTRIKKKMKRAKSYPPPGGDTAHAKPTTSEGRDSRPQTQRDSWTLTHASPQRLKRTTIIQNLTVGARNLDPKPSVKTFPDDLTAQLVNHPTPRRKVIKKKRSKKKKQPVTQATPPGIIEAEKLAELLDL